MQCPACQFDFGADPREVCPRCGRFVHGTPSRPSMPALLVRRRDLPTEPLHAFDPQTGASTDPDRPQRASDIPLAQFALGPLPMAVPANANAPGAPTDPQPAFTPARPSKIISKRAAAANGYASESGTPRVRPTVGSSAPNPSAETSLDLKLDPLIGTKIAGKYQLLELIAVGGMGKVYKARHVGLDRTVAVKMLKPSLLNDQTIVGRFEREAKAASRLSHPNAIQVFDFGDDGQGNVFLAMEYVQGRDLRALLLKEHPLGEARVCHIVAQVLAALADAHAQGIVHRDLKPENIMVETRRGEPDYVKVLDFGIAKILSNDVPTLTLADRICGTPLYMAPEQATGGQIDARTDLYSCGVILYQLVTGVLPFFSQNTVELLTKHVNEKALPPRQVSPELGVSPALDALIMKAMSKNPDDRPQSADAFRAALLALETADKPSPVTPLSPAREVKPISPDLLAKAASTPPHEPEPEPAPAIVPPPPRPVRDSMLDSAELPVALAKSRANKRYAMAGGLALVVLAALVFMRPSPPVEAPPAPPVVVVEDAPAAPPTTCLANMQLVQVAGFPSVCIDARTFPNEPGLKPRAKVTWANARALCQERGKRLCTEAEWERACEAAAPELAEWTATVADDAGRTYAVRGFGKGQARCTTRKAIPPGTKDAGIGLRCCANPT